MNNMENLAVVLQGKPYLPIYNIMQGVLEVYKDIKTVAIYGKVSDIGRYSFEAMSAVGSNSPEEYHAEDLLLSNINRHNIHKYHSFIMLNRIPCEVCMRNIFRQNWQFLTLLIPSLLSHKSKWFTSQVQALTHMNYIMQDDKDKSSELDRKYKLVYIDD